MGHGFKINNGQISMFYVGDKPWHGLGMELKSPATAEEAIVAAKLDWQVGRQSLYLQQPKSEARIRIEDKFAIVREDFLKEGEYPVLGIVGKEYTPLQNCEAFEFFDPIVGTGAAIYHTAGALGNGERVWILAKLPECIQVAGNDITDKYLLLSNSHDGNSSVQIKFTPIRVVCYNTLTMALSQGHNLTVRHGRNLHERLKNAERNLGIITERFDEIGDGFRAMARVKMNAEQVGEYFKLVFPDPANSNLDEKERQSALKIVQRNRTWSEYFFDQGKGNREKGVAGTLWAAYNGVTEYIDHRDTRQDDDRRLESIWFGEGYLTKARAFRIAEEKVKVWLN